MKIGVGFFFLLSAHRILIVHSTCVLGRTESGVPRNDQLSAHSGRRQPDACRSRLHHRPAVPRRRHRLRQVLDFFFAFMNQRHARYLRISSH